jgi:tetratricopeptide (TPR) repeat protein
MKRPVLLLILAATILLAWYGPSSLMAGEENPAPQLPSRGEMKGSIWVVSPPGILSGNFGGTSESRPFSEKALEFTRAAGKDLKKERWLDAIRHASAAIAIEPQLTDAYIDRSWAYIEKGLYKEATEDCQTALQLNPYSGEAYNNLGLVYHRQNLLVKAAAYYQQACQLGAAVGCANQQKLQKIADSLVKKSTGYFAKGQFDKVVDATTRAIGLDQNLAMAYVNRSGAYANLGQFEPAIADAKKATVLDPNNCLAFNNLGFAQEKSGDQTLAGVNYEISCSLGCKIGCNNQKRMRALAGQQ